MDRIGQANPEILVYSFLPASGVETVINLRKRLLRRLRENKEVIGSDTRFFEDEAAADMEKSIRDLYTEKSGVLDSAEADDDVDLASLALQVWQNATPADRTKAKNLPAMSFSAMRTGAASLDSVITYLGFPEGADALVWVDKHGRLLSRSAIQIFRNAACSANTPAVEDFFPENFPVVKQAVQKVVSMDRDTGGHMGTLRSTRRKVYERMKKLRDQWMQDLFAAQGDRSTRIAEIEKLIDKLYRFPMKEGATRRISRQLRLRITDEALLEMLKQEDKMDRLFVQEDTRELSDPVVVCSLGLKKES